MEEKRGRKRGREGRRGQGGLRGVDKCPRLLGLREQDPRASQRSPEPCLLNVKTDDGFC